MIEKTRELKKKSTSVSLTTLTLLTVWITTNCGKFLKRWEHQTTLSSSRKTCMQDKKQELGYGTMAWFKIGKGVHQGYILSPCLFNFCAGYIRWNARLGESQAGINIAGRNINNLPYVNGSSWMTKIEEEIKSLLMREKEQSEKAGLKVNIQKRRSCHPVLSLHGR